MNEQHGVRRPGLLIALALLLTGCNFSGGETDPDRYTIQASPSPARYLSAEIDVFDRRLTDLSLAIQEAKAQAQQADPEPGDPGVRKLAVFEQTRLTLHAQRWLAVQRAATHFGTTHREAFYGSRAFWHTHSTRGLAYALEELGDLNDPFYVDGRGNVRVVGDVNADIEVNGSAIVHILGDLNANLQLKGVCEVIVAGSIAADATITCDGQLELFVGGNAAGAITTTRSATLIIDGNATGAVLCGSPATTLTITGDLSADLAPPKDKGAVLTMRVDGFAPTSVMLNLSSAGFTRVNATLGRSNVPPGLYPDHTAAARPTARWVVLSQGLPSE